MAVHVNWILWPLSFFYRFWPDARVLLIAQVVFMLATAPVFVLIAKRILQSNVQALMAMGLFVSSPFFLHTIFNDFHPDSWQLPFLMAGLWAFYAGKERALILFSAVALLAKEDVSVILVGFSLFLFFQSGWKRTATILFFIAISVFLFHTTYLIPTFLAGKQTLLLQRYTFGESFKEVAASFLFRPGTVVDALLFEPKKYWYFLTYFFPAAGLTFLAPQFVLPCLISVLPHLLSHTGTQLSLADIYALPSQPFVFVGALIGFRRLCRMSKADRYKPLFIGVCFIVAGVGVYNAPKTFRSISKERLAAFYEMEKRVPADASVAAQQNLFPHFDTRAYVDLFPMAESMKYLKQYLLINPDYVVGDRIGNAIPFNGHDLEMALRSMEANPAYEKIFDRNEFVLYRRRNKEAPKWIRLS